MDYNDEKSIIDELIESLGIQNLDDVNNKKKRYNFLKSNDIKNTKPKEEYEIVMNCDDSNYIIYYKK